MLASGDFRLEGSAKTTATTHDPGNVFLVPPSPHHQFKSSTFNIENILIDYFKFIKKNVKTSLLRPRVTGYTKKDDLTSDSPGSTSGVLPTLGEYYFPKCFQW